MPTLYYKKPAILKNIHSFKGHAVIEASAGTGKTYTLEHLVLELLINPPDERKVDIEEILVVTFTEAATRELRERIRALIRRVLAEGTGLPEGDNPDHYWTINTDRAAQLREALFRFDGAAISTIHGFCQRILAEQAFLGGRLFEEKHADGSELFGTVFREEIRIALAEPGPTGEMVRSWLTEDMTVDDLEKLLYTCHREGSPERCPVTPVWNPDRLIKAINRLLPTKELLEAGGKLLTGQAFKSMQGIISDLDSALLQMKNDPGNHHAIEMFTEWARKPRSILKVKDSQLNHLRNLAAMPKADQCIKESINCLDQIVSAAAGPESFFVYCFLPRVQKSLNTRKNNLGLLDFDDMLLGVLDALRGPGSAALLTALRSRWRYALVDEFQDTDPVQWEIFKRIFIEGDGNQHLYVIGDPKQAIYGFRGADIYTYDLAKQEMLEKHGASRLPLTQNFRSTETIIDAVNQILTESDDHGKSFFDGLNRYDDLVQCGNPNQKAVSAEGKPVTPVYVLHLFAENEKLNSDNIKEGLYSYIAREINSLLEGPNVLYKSSSGSEPVPIKPSDIFVLTRTIAEGLKVGDILRCYGIPHAYYKQEGLYQTDEAENIYTLLRAISKPYDSGLRMSAWLTPFFDMPLDQLQKWQNTGDNNPHAALLFEWRRLAEKQDWNRLFDQIITESGLSCRLIFRDDERALTNYLHLIELLLAEIHARPLSADELARDLKARIEGRKKPEGREGEVQRLESDKEAVQILTMHKAKGLEAEVVFIAGGFSKPAGGPAIKTNIYHLNKHRHLHIGPPAGTIAAAVQRENEEENQRLFYVAITRAKSRLYLPFFGSDEANNDTGRQFGYSQNHSPYLSLQKQLQLLYDHGSLSNSQLFRLMEISCTPHPVSSNIKKTEVMNWPPPGLLEMPHSRSEDAARLKNNNKGVILTSYSRIKQGESWNPPPPGDDILEELRGDEAGRIPATGLQASDLEQLPGGRETGIYLHALLEETPPSEVRGYNFTEWSNSTQVQKRASELARQYAYRKTYITGALKLVYNALSSPLYVFSKKGNEQLKMPGGIASAELFNQEMSFIYPIPEKYHPLLCNKNDIHIPPGEDRFRVGRGYLQGLIDLVFKYNDLYYLLDWKSDRLPLFNRQTIADHVESNYKLQAMIYSLAVIRLMNVNREADYENRFGGVLYLFLRGLKEEGQQDSSGAVWFSRPPYSKLIYWEKELLQRNEWGT